ncbi:MAG: tetratricopeptide repeat protein [bacterium]
MLRNVILVMVVFQLAASVAFAQAGRKKVKQGNELYQQEKYDEANNKYRDALLEDPTSPIIHFNIGDVLYKKKNYQEALKSFGKALVTDDILLQSKSYYNMGNAYYKIGRLDSSIFMYKKALELNPDDEDAKFNLEFVRAKIKDEAQKQQQNPNQQQQQQQQQQQNESNQNENSEQQQQPQEPPQTHDDEENPQQEQQQEQQMTGEEKEISKEDAERILKALENEEEDLLRKHKIKSRGRKYKGRGK